MTPERRRSRENGIWLCQNHAKEIDDDDFRYAVGLLRAWRDRAESVAAEELGRPVALPVNPGLVTHRVLVPLGGERKITAEFVEDSGAPAAWGARRAELVRMALYEVSINAFAHGHASEVILQSEPGCIALICDGSKFGPDDLSCIPSRGGGDAIRALRDQGGSTLELNYKFDSSRNKWFILDYSHVDAANDPCGIDIMLKMTDGDLFANVEGCSEIHLYAGELWSFSDIHALYFQIREDLKGRQFVLHGISCKHPLAVKLRELLPAIKFTDSPG